MIRAFLHFVKHFVIPFMLVLILGVLAIRSTIPRNEDVYIQPFSSRATNGEGAVMIMNATNNIWKYVVIVQNDSTHEWKKQTLIIPTDRMSAMKVYMPKSSIDNGFTVYPIMAFKLEKPL